MKPAEAARRVWAIVPAAGRGVRFAGSDPNALPKQYTPLLGATVLEYALRALLAESRVHAVVVALAADDPHWAPIAAKLASRKLLTTVGGANRQDSVANGLEFLAPRAAPDDWVLVHDAARPCLGARDLGALLDAVGVRAADEAGSAGPVSAPVSGHAPGASAGAGAPVSADASGASGAARAPPAPPAAGAVLAAAVVDTMKRELGGRVTTVDRGGLWRALTPQIFAFAQLRRALQEARSAGVAVTDEAQAVERLGWQPVLVQGSPFNVKVTTADDLAVAARVLRMTEETPMRIGQGVDVHAFGEGDHVMLGGVRIAHAKGIVAHSDGDVVIHALCDALLGAMGDGDIGQHFPDTDPRYRGADSRVFLRVVAQRMRAAGLQLVNADITVLAEAPRLAAHRGAMAANLAEDLGVSARLINVKATTTERLGFIGRGEGLAALASVLLGPIGL
jgi:2-C-methyl-D-erythritol 2,4-cyclodiphosphate synthase